MHFTLSSLVTLLASATVALGLAVPPSLTGEDRLQRREYNELYVELAGCGGISAGEVAFVYLGNGVAPYALSAVNATDGTPIHSIATNVTESRYTWYTTPSPPVGSEFKISLTDSSGSSVESVTYSVASHPGYLRD